MSESKSKKRRKLKEAEAVETEPDAWERFEKAVHRIAPVKRAVQQSALVVIGWDSTPLESTLAKLSDAPPEIVSELLAMFDAGEELGRLETDDMPTPAGEFMVRLYPSDRLARLAAAF